MPRGFLSFALHFARSWTKLIVKNNLIQNETQFTAKPRLKIYLKTNLKKNFMHKVVYYKV